MCKSFEPPPTNFESNFSPPESRSSPTQKPQEAKWRPKPSRWPQPSSNPTTRMFKEAVEAVNPLDDEPKVLSERELDLLEESQEQFHPSDIDKGIRKLRPKYEHKKEKKEFEG